MGHHEFRVGVECRVELVHGVALLRQVAGDRLLVRRERFVVGNSDGQATDIERHGRVLSGLSHGNYVSGRIQNITKAGSESGSDGDDPMDTHRSRTGE